MQQEVLVPDLGQEAAAEIIEISIKEGDLVEKDDTLLVLESDKASMDIPAPESGKIISILVKIGDKIKTGDKIAFIETATNSILIKEDPIKVDSVKLEIQKTDIPKIETNKININKDLVYAGPGTRRFAREIGVDLDNNVTGSGRKQRIIKEDVKSRVKELLLNKGTSNFNVPEMPIVDFSKFGEIEFKPLSRIKKISGSFLHRNWVNIPHVTHFEEADITELENFRKSQKTIAEKNGVKMTPLVFIMKAVVAALQAFPVFNSSLDPNKEQFIFKKYYHIGVAVDTPNGLVVPVIRDVNKKGVLQLSKELMEISAKARNGNLTAKDMQGGCFSISSLGGIGGTNFTPIINAPEVAILGVSKAKMQPIYIEGEFQAKLILPFSLSYDHRVVDGADSARFCSFIANQLADIRRLLL